MDTISILQSLQVVDFDAGTVFSGTPSGKMVKGYAAPSLFTPAVDPNYIFHEQSRDMVVWYIDPSDPLYVYGPSGSGKTSCLKQLAAKLNFPVFEVTGHSRLEFPELIGHHVVRQGSMEFEYGPLALAMKFGGLALINELDLLEPSTAAGLNTKVFLRKGKRVGVDTAVHILIDSSGSMNAREIQLASQACFAVASALQSIKGTSVGVTTFPGERGVYEGSQREHWQTVAPILRHGGKMHTRFAMSGAGNTPLDSALWWTMQQLHPMPEPRKIILIITDG